MRQIDRQMIGADVAGVRLTPVLSRDREVWNAFAAACVACGIALPMRCASTISLALRLDRHTSDVARTATESMSTTRSSRGSSPKTGDHVVFMQLYQSYARPSGRRRKPDRSATPTAAQMSALQTATGRIDAALTQVRAINAGNGLRQIETVETRATLPTRPVFRELLGVQPAVRHDPARFAEVTAAKERRRR